MDTGCGFQVKLKSIIANGKIEKTLADTDEIKHFQRRRKPVLELQNRCSTTEPNWLKLCCYPPSGTYFGRVKVEGKLIRRSLHTHVLEVAKLRLSDFLKDLRRFTTNGPAVRGESPSWPARSESPTTTCATSLPPVVLITAWTCRPFRAGLGIRTAAHCA